MPLAALVHLHATLVEMTATGVQPTPVELLPALDLGCAGLGAEFGGPQPHFPCQGLGARVSPREGDVGRKALPMPRSPLALPPSKYHVR